MEKASASALGLALIALAWLAPPALGQATRERTPVLERAATVLRSDPVYVDPRAQARLDEATGARIRQRIEQSGAGPLYVAVLPADARDEAGGDSSAVGAELARRVGREGTYAVVVGNSFRAGATAGVLEPGQAAELARAALQASGDDGVGPTLLDFVDRVGAVRRERGDAGSGAGGGFGGGWLIALVAAGAGVLGVGRLLRRRREREARDREMDEVRETAREDLLALGEDIRALDLDVEMPGVDEHARADYGRAVEEYELASERLERARTPEELEPVSAALEEGRFAMASAKARLEGREPPDRRPPCFFDPRHAPSTRDVEWAPPGGEPRDVPACEADALRVEEGREPAVREVMAGGRPTPYWNAGPAYGPWAGGFFGGAAGGLLPGLLAGSLLGGGLGFGWPEDAYGGEGGGDLGSDDFGGGDFGGGDFGGGGFGGGE